MLIVKKIRCEYRKNPMGIDVAVPRFSWQLESEERGVLQAAYRIQAAKGDPGFSSLVWDSGIIHSDTSVHVEYGGEPQESRTRYYYRVRIWDNKGNDSGWSDPAFWETGLLKEGDWKAGWITADDGKTSSDSEACPYFRKEFHLSGEIRSARIYSTALGLYEIHLNGSRVGDHLFTPGWTSYNNRLQYQTYDVTELLKEGCNAVGVILGNGWYKGNIAWNNNGAIYGCKLAVMLQLNILYKNGQEDVIVSDTSWKTSSGPILMSEIYHGETYDARQEKEGWNLPGYDDSGWCVVHALDYTGGRLIAQESVPVRIIEEISPVSVFNTPKGESVIDFGQNMVGWVRFKVEGPAGTEVTLKHAEVLDRDGSFYTDNLRKAKQTIKYILKGCGIETYQPHFTFQGFRYVKVEGYPGELKPENFTGMVIHSDMEVTGNFRCSDKLVNQLQHNILWGQKGNFLDVPTDCPQRDERLGWTGDAQMFIRTACFNMNVALFFTKWLRDLYAEQSAEKGVPFVIPHVLGENDYSSSAWGDASTICPWTIYTCYGDRRILEEQYESMKMWVEYIRAQGDNEYLWNTGFHFGDWVGLDAKPDSYVGATSRDFIATAFYACSASIVAKAAGVLGKNEDRAEYEKLHANIVKNFREEFVSPNGRLVSPTQTAHVLALMFGLVEEKHRKRTVEALVGLIEENKCHLDTGFVGTPYICHVLSENGHNDLAYRLLLQKDYPSWLYQVTKGATTIWEHWDGIKEDGSFWSPDMNSFNHYAYGSIGDWLYRVAAGIDAGKPGYKHIYIRPRPGNGLTFVEASLDSPYGVIKSAWKKDGDALEIRVTIPANTTASIILPFAKQDAVYESGKKLQCSEGVTVSKQTDNGLMLELVSGQYLFTYLYSLS